MTRQIVVSDEVYETLAKAQYHTNKGRGPHGKRASLSDVIKSWMRHDYVLHKAQGAIRDAQALLGTAGLPEDAPEALALESALLAIEKRIDGGL